MNSNGSRARKMLVLLVVALVSAGVFASEIKLVKSYAKATWSCMALNWDFEGDDNRNARCTVLYRRSGTQEWRKALPLLQIQLSKIRKFSGSVFRLAPGTAYEFKLAVTDKDGGGEEKLITAKTLDYPVMPEKRVEATGTNLAEIHKTAEPGTVILLKAGVYKGALLKRAGQPGKPIVYMPAGDGEVKVEGRLTLGGHYIWLHGLNLSNPKSRPALSVSRGLKGTIVTNCKLHSSYGVWAAGGAENLFVSDCFFRGTCNGLFAFGGEGVDMGKSAGRCGNAISFNEFTDMADAVSYGRGNIDVYNNYIHETLDDFVEPDYGFDNYRVWNNRCYNSMCGFSFQPLNGGPWYFFDNINVGAYLHPFKVKEVYGPSVICGNTVMTKGSQVMNARSIFRGAFVNNIWMRATKGRLGYGGSFGKGGNDVKVDHNLYCTSGVENISGFSKVAKAKGWEKNSKSVDYKTLFVTNPVLPKGNPKYPAPKGVKIGETWNFDHCLYLPKEESDIIDAGTSLPNITGPFLGKARDAGAHEFGLGTAFYGRRTWDLKTGLVFGVPEKWKVASLDKAGELAALGCKKTDQSKVLLISEDASAFGTISVETTEDEKRWTAAKEALAADKDAVTPVLAFQDGLYMRLYETGGVARLVGARVETKGILRMEAGCKSDDLKKNRIAMFQFMRSFVR